MTAKTITAAVEQQISLNIEPVTAAVPTIVDYEKSVTDKENALINSFSNLIVNSQQQQQQNNHLNHMNLQKQEISNGKTTTTMTTTNGGSFVAFDDLVNEDHQQPQQQLITSISNGNGHTDRSIDNNKV